MYKSITLLPLLLLSFLHLTCATAIPNDNDDDNDRHSCLTDAQAHTILYKWISFFEKTDPKVAERTLTKDFQLISSSTNFLEGKNVRTSSPYAPNYPRSHLPLPIPTYLYCFY